MVSNPLPPCAQVLTTRARVAVDPESTVPTAFVLHLPESFFADSRLKFLTGPTDGPLRLLLEELATPGYPAPALARWLIALGSSRVMQTAWRMRDPP